MRAARNKGRAIRFSGNKGGPRLDYLFSCLIDYEGEGVRVEEADSGGRDERLEGGGRWAREGNCCFFSNRSNGPHPNLLRALFKTSKFLIHLRFLVPKNYLQRAVDI